MTEEYEAVGFKIAEVEDLLNEDETTLSLLFGED